ncbi:MAG TPA: hypothetical protein PLN21_12480 [Gemmatales bacterium]|nr:hypothetical protein [Gemmatales bacterium]
MSQRLIALCCCFILPAIAWAELPPGTYDQLRREAEEALVIQITSVRVERDGDYKNVTLEARVLRVGRSKSGLAKDDNITIKYEVSMVPFPGPRPVSILNRNQTYPAFLKSNGNTYEPAAYGMSFNSRPE